MQVKDIKFTTVETINYMINSLEKDLNAVKFTMYNGFNFHKSFLNRDLIERVESDINYLKSLRDGTNETV